MCMPRYLRVPVYIMQTGLNVTESFRLLMDRISELRPAKFRDSIAIPKLETNVTHKKKCIIS